MLSGGCIRQDAVLRPGAAVFQAFRWIATRLYCRHVCGEVSFLYVLNDVNHLFSSWEEEKLLEI